MQATQPARNRRQAGSSGQETDRKRADGSRQQAAGSRKRTAGSRKQEAGSRIRNQEAAGQVNGEW